jgi:hypothetical protein
MNPKLQKTVREIERTNAKITELQALLPELEKQKTELENTEIVRLVRSASVAPADLEAFLRTLRAGTAAPPVPAAARNFIGETEATGDEN